MDRKVPVFGDRTKMVRCPFWSIQKKINNIKIVKKQMLKSGL